MVGGLIKQEKVVIGAQKARQPYPITLSHREVCEKPDRVRLRVERFERDLHAPFGIPRIERFGMFQRGRVLLLRPVRVVRESESGGVECLQRGQRFGDRLRDRLSNSSTVSGGHLLLGNTDRADALDCSGVRGQDASEHLQERRFPPPVLAHDRDTR